MKKVLSTVLAFVMLLSFVPVLADDGISVTIDGTAQVFDQMPVMENSRVLVPMRAIFEALGASIAWDETTETVTGTLNSTTVKLTINNTTAFVNNSEVVLDVPAKLINSRTMVPVRFISESLGAKVDWNDAAQTVVITSTSAPAVGTKRNVPTQFTKSSALDDLIYYTDGGAIDPLEIFKTLPEGIVAVSEEDFLKCGISGKEYGSAELIDVEGAPFTQARRATITTVPDSAYSIQFKAIPKVDFKKGDLVMVVLYMRTESGGRVESGTGQIQVVVEEKTTGTSKKIVTGNMEAGKDWTIGFFPFIAADGFLTNLHLNIRLGYHEQVVDIGGVQVINYENKLTIDDVPMTDGYPGMEHDAQWRKDALVRIEQIRKGDVKVVVQDAAGNAISDADVKIDMTEHEFEWGTAINANVLGTTEANKKYQEEISKQFNGVIFSNEHKWKYYEADPGKARAMVDWCKANNVRYVRGHTLMWESTTSNWSIPDDVYDILAAKDRAAFDKRTKDHITKIVSDFKGEISDWDVVNEMVRNTTFRSVFGNELILDWLKWTREADPDTELYLSETGMIGVDNTMEAYRPILEFLKENNAEYDGICTHGHFGAACDPMLFYNQLSQLGEYTDSVKISEFDFNSPNQAVQGDFTRDIMIACFSHEKVDGFYMWGFWDGSHWLTNAPIYNKDWTLKPSGEQWEDLVYNKWWTRESGKTDASGEFSLRAFYGDYEVTATANGVSKTVTAVVAKGADNTITIVLD